MSKDEKVVYPADFVAAVKAEWPPPGDKMISERLAAGEGRIGQILLQASSEPFTAQDVATYLKAGAADRLEAIADRRLRLGKLYEWWKEIVAVYTPPRRELAR